MLLQNCKTNHADPHNPCLHCVQVIFQKLFHNFFKMFCVQLQNALLHTFKNEAKKIMRIQTDDLIDIFKVKKTGTEIRLLLVPNGNF